MQPLDYFPPSPPTPPPTPIPIASDSLPAVEGSLGNLAEGIDGSAFTSLLDLGPDNPALAGLYTHYIDPEIRDLDLSAVNIPPYEAPSFELPYPLITAAATLQPAPAPTANPALPQVADEPEKRRGLQRFRDPQAPTPIVQCTWGDCNGSFLQAVRDFDAHCAEAHPLMGVHRCLWKRGACGATPSDFRKHVLECTTADTSVCPNCQQIFCIKRVRNAHMKKCKKTPSSASSTAVPAPAIFVPITTPDTFAGPGPVRQQQTTRGRVRSAPYP